MKLFRLGQGVDVVWTLDPDVTLPPTVEATEEALDGDGKPSREGRMVPVSTPGLVLADGAAVFTIRPMTVAEYSSLSPDTKNAQIVTMCTIRARETGSGATYEGSALAEILEANGLALIGDLAHAIWSITVDPHTPRR